MVARRRLHPGRLLRRAIREQVRLDGEVAAAAVLAALLERPLNREPVLNNACYSFINDREAVHIASVHRYDDAQKTFVSVPGATGLSAEKSAVEGEYGFAWARAIWKDMLG